MTERSDQKELVSIIIPAYQEEKRIGRCLESILQSTYRNLELIVVNDGSTDRTEEIVRSFMERTMEHSEPSALSDLSDFSEPYGPVVRLITIPNSGPAHARNTGLRQAKGQIIGFVDSDDRIDPHMIERLAQCIYKGRDLAACGMSLCDENGKTSGRQRPVKEQSCRCPRQALELVMWDQILMSCCLALFRKDKILDSTGKLLVSFPENGKNFEDFSFICQYLSRCHGFMEILPFHGYFYCRRPGSVSRSPYSVRELCRDLQPLLHVGEQMVSEGFTAHKIQYAFRFMAFWYVEAQGSRKRDFSPGCESWDMCMNELEKYADIYMKAPNVSLYRKFAMWIVRRHPGIGRLLAKTVGRILL